MHSNTTLRSMSPSRNSTRLQPISGWQGPPIFHASTAFCRSTGQRETTSLVRFSPNTFCRVCPGRSLERTMALCLVKCHWAFSQLAAIRFRFTARPRGVGCSDGDGHDLRHDSHGNWIWRRKRAIRSLGRAVIGGLVFSTLTTLTVLPAIYALLQGKASTTSNSLNPENPSSRYYVHP
jgi:hypothetical protein